MKELRPLITDAHLSTFGYCAFRHYMELGPPPVDQAMLEMVIQKRYEKTERFLFEGSLHPFTPSWTMFTPSFLSLVVLLGGTWKKLFSRPSISNINLEKGMSVRGQERRFTMERIRAKRDRGEFFYLS